MYWPLLESGQDPVLPRKPLTRGPHAVTDPAQQHTLRLFANITALGILPRLVFEIIKCTSMILWTKSIDRTIVRIIRPQNPLQAQH